MVVKRERATAFGCLWRRVNAGIRENALCRLLCRETRPIRPLDLWISADLEARSLYLRRQAGGNATTPTSTTKGVEEGIYVGPVEFVKGGRTVALATTLMVSTSSIYPCHVACKVALFVRCDCAPRAARVV